MSELEKTYSEALQLASEHYENFPVISLLIPKLLRKHVAVIYKFSRVSDDIADEGDDSPEVRIKKLDEYEEKFTNCLNNNFADDYWCALKNTIDLFGLKKEYFYDLLSAFKQDVTKKRYNNFEELLDYCRRSADPVGRIMLQLFRITNQECYKYSDYVCTSLQLINLYQDISIDYKKGRIYIPMDEMKKFGVDENIIAKKSATDGFKKLMKFQLQRNLKMFMQGNYLIEILPYRLKYQISWTIYGGRKILYKIIGLDYDVLNNRPVLSKIDYLLLMFKGFVG
jgi:squalene synthase HpnC